MRTVTLSFILGVLAGPLAAQDSLVYFHDVRFSSPLEQEAFLRNLVRGESEPFDLFVASGSLLNDAQVVKAKSEFYQLLKDLNTERFAARKPEQRAKAMAKAVEGKYLKKYVAGSSFEDILHRGDFSEVSGTALYCLGLDYLDIPYQIKEEPQNAYVIACPGPKQVMIQSSVSSMVFTTFDGVFKKEFVETLKKQKLISEEEYSREGINPLFEKYYFNSNDLFTLRALAGLQYFNMGMDRLQQQRYAEAFQHFEKSHLLLPSPRVAYMLLQSGAASFHQLKVKDSKHAALLGKISRYEGLGLTSKEIAGEFFGVVNDLLFDDGQKTKLDDYHRTLLEYCHNPVVTMEINFVYQSELGRYKYNDARYNEALPFLEEALRLKPTSQPASSMLVQCLSQLVANYIEDDEFLATISAYPKKLPEIGSNNQFNSLLASCYLAHAAIDFERAKPAEGEVHRKDFEELFQAHQDIRINSGLLGRAYSAAAVHYFRKGQTKKAKEYLATGLKISPNNYELTSRQQMIR